MSDFDIWTESINRGELIQRTDENLGTEYQERLRTNPRNSLSHLTDEQKKLRRALRNRVNAAACRERKATEAKNARLKISTLEKQNTKLTSELERLKELNALYTMQLEEHGITPATLSEQFGQLGEAESFTALQVSSDSRQNQAFSTDRPAVFLDTVNANALPNVLPVAPQGYVDSVEMFDPSHAPLNLSDVGLTSSEQYYPSASINDASLLPLDDVGHLQPIRSVLQGTSRQNQAFSTDRPAVFLDTVNANALPNVLPVAPQEYVDSVEMFDPSHAPLNLSDVGLTSSEQYYPSASINDASLLPLDDVGHLQPIRSVLQGTSRQNQAFSPDRPAVFLDTADANVLPNVWPVTPQEYVHSVEMFDPSHAPLNLSDVGLTSSKQFYPSASINDASLPPLDDVGHSQPIQSVYSRDARSINDQLDAHPSFNYLHYGVDGSHNTNAPEQLPSEISLAKPGTSGSTMGVPKHDKDTLKRIVGNGRVNPDDSPAPKMQKRGASVIAQTPPPIGAQPRLRRVMVQPQRTIIAKPSQTLDRVAIQPATNIQASEETASRNFSQGSLSRTFDEVARANGRSTR